MRLLKPLRSVVKALRKERKHWNSKIDKIATPVSFEEIACSNKQRLNVAKKDVVQWLRRGGLSEFASGGLHKKGLEFFFSSCILNINQEHVVLDAAGGKSGYLKAVKANTNANSLYLTDHIFNGIKEMDNGVNVVGGDISAIQLPDMSVDKIACHHAFEHFQKNKDQTFVSEAYRILKDSGELVIIPIFITDQYFECWNIETDVHFDENAIVVIDETASIPGAQDDGHFARFYSNKSLVSRIIDPAIKIGFNCMIIECEVDNETIPDMTRNFGSIINRPLRALKFTKG